MINQITIVGLGLIGGSIARAIRPTGFCETIIVFDTDLSNVQQAYAESIIDGAETNLGNAVKDAKLIIIASPLKNLGKTFNTIAKHAKADAIITDVCSVKLPVITLAKKYLEKKFGNFVPGHPLAGLEKSGFAAARSDLFANRKVLLTPLPTTFVTAINIVKDFWQQVDAKVVFLKPDVHDKFLATTSHLPQLLAYNFMNYVGEKDNCAEVMQYTGSGFKDFIRIAASNPQMWTDICLANQKILITEIKAFQKQLTKLQHILTNKQEKELQKLFSKAQKRRLAVEIYGS